MQTYLSFPYVSDIFSDEACEIHITRLENPDEKLKNLFCGPSSIYIVSEPDLDKLHSVIANNLKYYYDMDCSNNKENALCEVFSTSGDYIIKRREFINVYDGISLLPEENKYTAIGYFLAKEHQLIFQKVSAYNTFYTLSLFYEKNILHLYTCAVGENKRFKNKDMFEYKKNAAFIDDNDFNPDGSIESIEVDGKTLNLNCGTGNLMFSGYYALLYYYYCSLGCIPEELTDKAVCIYDHSFDEDTAKDLLPIHSLKLSFRVKYDRYLLQKTFTVASGEGEKDTKIYYTDPQDGQQKYFYLDGLRLIDIYEILEETMAQAKEKGIEFSEEDIEDIAKTYEHMCPRDRRMVAVVYEVPFDDASFQMDLKCFFDGETVLENMSIDSADDAVISSTSSIGYIFFDDTLGINGYKAQYQVLSIHPVEPDFSDELIVEVLSISKKRRSQEPILITYNKPVLK